MNPDSPLDFYTCDLGGIAALNGNGSYDTAGGFITDYSWAFDTQDDEDASGPQGGGACGPRQRRPGVVVLTATLGHRGRHAMSRTPDLQTRL